MYFQNKVYAIVLGGITNAVIKFFIHNTNLSMWNVGTKSKNNMQIFTSFDEKLHFLFKKKYFSRRQQSSNCSLIYNPNMSLIMNK